MNNARNALGIGVALVAAFAGSALAQQTPPQHLLESLQEITGVPGLSAAVSDQGKIIWTGSAGLADVQHSVEITDQTNFRLASVSKLFTAALILKLSEQDLFDLDADIRTYVPEWQADDDAEITLRQLAAHVSGIGHYSATDLFDASVSYEMLRDSIAIYGHKPLLFTPGDAYSYSSYGYALMGAAVEAVTRQSFDDAMNDLIFTPFALPNTLIENTASIPQNSTALYSIDGGQRPVEITRNSQRHVRGATGMLSTPSDLLIFANAYASAAIVSADMRNMSWTPVQLNDGTNAGETRYDIGFGWRIGRDWDGRSVVHHAGVTPGARSILSINRDAGTAVALLSNASWTSRMETTGEMIATAATEGVRLRRSDCPEGDWAYRGMFIEDKNDVPDASNASGQIHISFAENLCRGELQPEGAIANWLINRGARAPSMKLTLVAKRNSETSIFAMATPWGGFPMYFSNVKGKREARGDIAGREVLLALSLVKRNLD